MAGTEETGLFESSIQKAFLFSRKDKIGNVLHKSFDLLSSLITSDVDPEEIDFARTSLMKERELVEDFTFQRKTSLFSKIFELAETLEKISGWAARRKGKEARKVHRASRGSRVEPTNSQNQTEESGDDSDVIIVDSDDLDGSDVQVLEEVDEESELNEAQILEAGEETEASGEDSDGIFNDKLDEREGQILEETEDDSDYVPQLEEMDVKETETSGEDSASIFNEPGNQDGNYVQMLEETEGDDDSNNGILESIDDLDVTKVETQPEIHGQPLAYNTIFHPVDTLATPRRLDISTIDDQPLFHSDSNESDISAEEEESTMNIIVKREDAVNVWNDVPFNEFMEMESAAVDPEENKLSIKTEIINVWSNESSFMNDVETQLELSTKLEDDQDELYLPNSNECSLESNFVDEIEWPISDDKQELNPFECSLESNESSNFVDEIEVKMDCDRDDKQELNPLEWNGGVHECGKGFASPWHLKRHMKIHKRHNRKSIVEDEMEVFTKLECERDDLQELYPLECSLESNFVDQVNASPKVDCNQDEQEVNPLACSECGMCVKSQWHLQRHLKIHKPKRSRKLMKNIKKNISTKRRVFKSRPEKGAIIRFHECDICGKKLKRTTQLKVHKKFVHVEAALRPFECEICGKRFKQTQHLDVHKKSIHENASIRLHKCDICGKKFKQLGHLKTHTQIVHEEATIRRYECDSCGLKFKQIGTLKTHKKTIHGVVDPDLIKSRWNCSERNDPYGAAQSDKNELKIDIDRPHVCDICGCGFAMPGHLKQHIRKMHGAKHDTIKSVKHEHVHEPVESHGDESDEY